MAALDRKIDRNVEAEKLEKRPAAIAVYSPKNGCV